MVGLLLAGLSLVAAGGPPDLLKPPRQEVEARGGDRAVVIGVAEYAFLPQVSFAARDAEAFMVMAQSSLGLSRPQIDLLDTLGETTRESILSAVEDAGRSAGPEDTVWIYFAGHGGVDPQDGERLLLGDDTRSTVGSFGSRGVRVEELEALATSGGARVVVLLDACYNGRVRGGEAMDIEQGRFAVPNYEAARRSGSVVLSAAAPTEIAMPLESAEHGAFTYFAVGALRGWADGAGAGGVRDGRVTAGELQAYIAASLRVPEVRDQTPTLDGDGGAVLSLGREGGPPQETWKVSAPKQEAAIALPPEPRPQRQPRVSGRQVLGGTLVTAGVAAGAGAAVAYVRAFQSYSDYGDATEPGDAQSLYSDANTWLIVGHTALIAGVGIGFGGTRMLAAPGVIGLSGRF